MTRWYRAYEGTTTDSKIGEVALVAECSRAVVIATWHAILESCAADQAGGSFSTTARRIAAALGEPSASVERVFAGLSEVGMVADGAVCAWTKRQFESDNSTERSRRHRAARRNGDATLQQREETSLSDSVSVSESSEAQSERVSATDFEELFDRLWLACPKREGANPQTKARERFRHALQDGHDPELIIAAAARWREREQKLGNIGGRFVSRVDVWLGDQEWTDVEPAVPIHVRPPPEGEFVEVDSARWHELAAPLRRVGRLMPPANYTLNGKRGAYIVAQQQENAA